MYTVFLSHASHDKPKIRRLAVDLTRAGVTVWLDEWEIKVGEPIIQRIEQGLRQSQYIAVWLTERSVSSGWVQREWYSKFHQEIETGQVAVLPLLGEPCIVPELLRGKLYADFVHSYQSGLTSLLAALDVEKVPSQADLESFIAAGVDVAQFRKEPHWGNDYRVVTVQQSFDEATWVFWNERTLKLEKWWSDAVRWYGPGPLMLDDLQEVARAIGRFGHNAADT